MPVVVCDSELPKSHSRGGNERSKKTESKTWKLRSCKIYSQIELGAAMSVVKMRARSISIPGCRSQLAPKAETTSATEIP